MSEGRPADSRRTYRDILLVDLLGGIGDLLMILPAVHALARRNPGAAVRVLTHDPGAQLVRGDPAVTEVLTPTHRRPGAEREAVAQTLAVRRPDLAVTTTRYDGIPALLEESGARCVTDLWRRPPPDELVTRRYLRILYEEGLLDADDVAARPRVHLTAAERADGERVLAGLVQAVPVVPGTTRPAPAVLVTQAGMAVKRWPQRHWRRLVAVLRGRGHPVLTVDPDGPAPAALPAPALPAGDLRQLAARFAAVAHRGGVVVGADTGPVRLAAAAGARTVALFGPTLASRYGLGEPDGLAPQGLPDCPHRRPTAITEQICWWDAACPLAPSGSACMADLGADLVAEAALRLLATR